MLITYLLLLLWPIVALRPVMDLPHDVYDRLSDIHNSLRGHVGLKLCKRRLKKITKQCVTDNQRISSVTVS